MKQWSSKLRPEQRELLEQLPVGSVDPTAMVAMHEAVSCAFVVQARRICAEHGVEWPHTLERETRAYLRNHGLPALDDAD